jgi:hypothetical protein
MGCATASRVVHDLVAVRWFIKYDLPAQVRKLGGVLLWRSWPKIAGVRVRREAHVLLHGCGAFVL